MKTYVKPELRFESYELNHSVADCGWELKLNDVSVCFALNDSGLSGQEVNVQAFTAENFLCNYELGPGDYCYENGLDGTSLFRS